MCWFRLTRLLDVVVLVSGGNTLVLDVGYARRWWVAQTFPNGHGVHQGHLGMRTMFVVVGFLSNNCQSGGMVYAADLKSAV